MIFRQSLLIVAFSFLLPAAVSHSCGPYIDVFKGYEFLKPHIFIKNHEFPQLLGGYSDLTDWHEYTWATQDQYNLEEWRAKFCDYATLEDIHYVIYKAAIEDLEALSTATRSKSMPVPAMFMGNTFARQLKDNRCSETVEYLLFARDCEPFVVAPDPWEESLRDSSQMLALAAEGKAAFLATESPYIRMRYAYQIVRLAHYAGAYKTALKLYEELTPMIDPRVESIIAYWLLGHKAGALQALGKNVEAAHLYAKIFLHAPGKREQAFRSFKLKNDAEWEACLLRCESDNTRAALYAMRAYMEHSKAAGEMSRIYHFQPNSPFLPALLIREVKKLEKDFLGRDFDDNRSDVRPHHRQIRRSAGQYLKKLQRLIDTVLTEKKIQDTILWKTSDGYLSFLASDYTAAKQQFREVRNIPSLPDSVRQQISAFELAMDISENNMLTPAFEKTAYDLLSESPLFEQYHDFKDFLLDKMAYLYKKYDAPGMAFLCHHPLSDLKPNPQMPLINNMLAVAQKKQKSDFEELLLAQKSGENITPALWDIKATEFFREGKLEAAMETFKNIPRSQWDDFGQYNPFIVRFSFCIHCPLADTIQQFNKGEILQNLMDLEYQAKANIGQNAGYYYRLGVAWYNMSYFGYAWPVLDYFRSGANWYYRNAEHVYTTWQFPYGNRENHQLDRARFYLEQALILAREPELAARAAFMLARCEQDEYYVQPNKPQQKPRKYFQVLNSKYQNTEFYERIIGECKYFEAFTMRNGH